MANLSNNVKRERGHVLRVGPLFPEQVLNMKATLHNLEKGGY